MPTGYTAPVADGTITDFRTFALSCARAFGALITMRDDPATAPIPEEFQVDSHYRKRVEAARADLGAARAMTVEDAVAAQAEEARSQVEADERIRTKKRESEARYEAMLADVRGWVPPSPDHVEMKEFMVSQLVESIRWDCGDWGIDEPEPMEPEVWLARHVEQKAQALASAEEALRQEEERVAGRNRWVRQLRESLPEPQVTVEG